MPIFDADTYDCRNTTDTWSERFVPSCLSEHSRETREMIARSESSSFFREDTVARKMIREFEMYGSLPVLALQGIQEKLSDPAALAVELGVTAAVGVGFLALSRKPTMFGKAAQEFVSSALENSRLVRDLFITVDLGERVISPGMLTWSGKENDQAARALLGRNIGGAVVDYSLGMFTFAKAGRMAFGKSPYIAPTKYRLDPHNLSIGAMSTSAVDRLLNYYDQ